MSPDWEPSAPSWEPFSSPSGEDEGGEESARNRRGTTLLALVMMGWLFFTMALAAFAGDAPSSLEPVSLERGVIVTPAPGWSSAQDLWEPGPSQTAFKKAGVVSGFVADADERDAQAILDEQIADIESQFSSVRVLPVASLSIDEGLPALRVLFDGVSGSAELEGELVAASRDGTGVIMLALAPVGQLRRVQDDLDAMLETLVVP